MADYYGVSSLLTQSEREEPQITETDTFTVTGSTTRTTVVTVVPTSTFLINSNLESVDVPTTRPPGVVITLPTPFVYQPTTGATGKVEHGTSNCNYGEGTEGWGYPPQTLLDFMVKDPTISKQYLVSHFPLWTI